MATFSETRTKVVEYVKEHKALTLGSLVILGVGILLIGIISSISGATPSATTPPPITTPPITTPNPTPTTPGTTPPAGNTTELNLWGGFFSEADIAPLISKYEAANSGIKINYSNEIIRSSDISGYRAKIDDAVGDANNQLAPDIFIADSGWAGSFLAKTAPAPADVYTASSYKTTFHDFVSTDFVNQDKIYGAPLWVDNFALIYNKSLWKAAGLSEPDKDWNTFANEQVPELTKKDSSGKVTQSGFAAGISSNSEFWFEAMNMLMLQNKVALSGTESKLSSGDTAQKAINFYRDFAKGSKQSWNSEFNPDVAAFLEGKLATYLAPSWRLNDIVRYNEAGELGLEIGVVEVPQLQTATDAKANMASYWGFMVNKASVNSDAAWDFLKFLTEDANIRLLHDTIKTNNKNYIGLLFPLKSLISSQASDPYLGSYAKALSYTKSWFMVDEDGVRKVYKEILDNNKDLKSADTEINKVLKGS